MVSGVLRQSEKVTDGRLRVPLLRGGGLIVNNRFFLGKFEQTVTGL